MHKNTLHIYVLWWRTKLPCRVKQRRAFFYGTTDTYVVQAMNHGGTTRRRCRGGGGLKEVGGRAENVLRLVAILVVRLRLPYPVLATHAQSRLL